MSLIGRVVTRLWSTVGYGSGLETPREKFVYVALHSNVNRAPMGSKTFRDYTALSAPWHHTSRSGGPVDFPRRRHHMQRPLAPASLALSVKFV